MRLPRRTGPPLQGALYVAMFVQVAFALAALTQVVRRLLGSENYEFGVNIQDVVPHTAPLAAAAALLVAYAAAAALLYYRNRLGWWLALTLAVVSLVVDFGDAVLFQAGVLALLLSPSARQVARTSRRS